MGKQASAGLVVPVIASRIALSPVMHERLKSAIEATKRTTNNGGTKFRRVSGFETVRFVSEFDAILRAAVNSVNIPGVTISRFPEKLSSLSSLSTVNFKVSNDFGKDSSMSNAFAEDSLIIVQSGGFVESLMSETVYLISSARITTQTTHTSAYGNGGGLANHLAGFIENIINARLRTEDLLQSFFKIH